MQTNGPCSAMIRQVIDGKGSFIKSTKEYVEFRDLAVWCSFSLSASGYPQVPSRLLRHFHMVSPYYCCYAVFIHIWHPFTLQILIPDQSDHVFAQVVPMFITSFRRRYEGPFGDMTSVVHRLVQFPVQMYKRARKLWRPSAVTPHLLFSIGSVLSVFISLMNVSLSRVPVDPISEFELLTMHFTLQLHRNRFVEQSNRDQLQSIAIRITKKLGFSSQNLAYLRTPAEYFFADCGDTEGITRVSARTLTTIFVAGEERFHWYHKATLKANMTPHETILCTPETLTGQDDHIARSIRGKRAPSVRHLLPAGTDGFDHEPSSTQETILRRSSLVMVALKTGLPDEKVTAAPSFCQLQNTLDIYSFLQSGVRHLLLTGSDTADRRSTTMVACGTLSFQFREVCTQLRLADFIEHVKSIVLEAGLRATQTVVYTEFEDLTADESALLMHLIRQDDIPPHMYSSADKVKLYAMDHKSKGLPNVPPPTRKSFLLDPSYKPENEKGTGHSAASSLAHLLTVFRENVRRSLYIVLSIGFVIKTFPRWQDVSAEAVCNSALHEWTMVNDIPKVSETRSTSPSDGAQRIVDAAICAQVRDIMIVAHHTAEKFVSDGIPCFGHHLPSQTLRGRRFGSVTTQLDDMLRVFKVLFTFQHTKLEHQVRDLSKALRFLAKRLSQANIRVAKEESSEALQNDAAQAVLDTTGQLAAQEAIEKEARRLFLLDEERCAKIQSEIELERASIQRELSKTLPDVQEATEALSQINKYHIVEMKSFTNPPQLVRLVMQAVCVLLDAPPTWSEALRILADIRFLDRLRNFNKDCIDPSLIDRVKFYVNHPDFSMENMRRASLASTTLCKWVLALVRYFEAMKRVAPTQKLLDETERSFRIIEERAQAEKKKLIDIEMHLAELRVLHAQNVQREAELQRTQETRLRWKSSVASFGRVIKQWYDITRKHLESFELRQMNLLGDCALVSTLVIFGAELFHEDREKMLAQCRAAIQSHFASPLNESYPMAAEITAMLRHWVLSGESIASQLRKTIVDMQDNEDDAFATSLFLMDQAQQVCFKIPFLIDPLDRGVSWIKEAYRSSSTASPFKGSVRNETSRPFGDNNAGHRARDEVGVTIVVDAGDPNLIRTIEACLAQTPPTMSCLRRKVHVPHFAVVDFTPTRRDLDSHFLAILYRGSRALDQRDLESLKSKLSVEKIKEEEIFKTFLAILCAASDETTKASSAGLSPTAASIFAAWISSGTGNQGFYDEVSMERISLQLNDFMSVRNSRKQLQQNIRDLNEKRRKGLAFARRARAFVMAENGISKMNVSLKLPLSQTIANIAKCFVQSLPTAAPTPDRGNMTNRTRIQQQETPAEAVCFNTCIQSATTLITTAYIYQRLASLPTALHRAYLLCLVLAIGDIDNEENQTFGMLNHRLTERVKERILRLCSEPSLDCHHFTQNSSKDKCDVLSQIAQEVVDVAVRVAILAVVSGACCGKPVGAGKRLDNELITPLSKIYEGFLYNSDTVTAHGVVDAFRHSLYNDMIENAYDWKTYLKSSVVRANLLTTGRTVQWPPWVKRNLRLLGQLQVHMCLFGCIPLEVIDGMIKEHLGEQEMLSLLGMLEGGRGFVRPSLDALAKSASFSTPLLILSDSSEFAVAGSSSVRHCARKHDIPAEAVAFMSVGHTDLTRGTGGIWSYREKPNANTTEGDPIARDTAAVTKLKEISMDPGWAIVEGAVGAPSLSITNAMRLQIVRFCDVKSTNHSFRLWLVEDLSNTSAQPAIQHRDLGVIPAQRLFFEPPQTLRQHYDAFLQAEKEQREVKKLKKKLENAQSNQEGQRRPPPLSRHASSILIALQRSYAEQQHIRAALWLFHSIFRLHAQDSRNIAKNDRTISAVPADMFLSYYEMDRTMRLIQLHLHQRVVATTVTNGTSALIQTSTPSATASAEAHGKTLTELASLIYIGRLWGDCRASQCRDLLTLCLHYDTLDLHSTEHDTQLVSQILQLRERLVATTMPPRKHLFENLELDLVPTSLQTQHRAYETSSILHSLTKIYGAAPSTLANKATDEREYVLSAVASLPCAQQQLEELTAVLPDKTSLSSSIRQLRRQKRESMIIGWGRNNTRSAVEVFLNYKSIRQPPKHQGRVSTLRRQQYLQTQLQQQPTAHLIHVELPAMESYLTFIWTSVETLLSLRADSVEMLNPDTIEAIQALARGDIPLLWRGETTKSECDEGYATPTQLRPWLCWLQQAVNFCHAHQRSVLALAPVRIDSIWLPALQRPKG
ncbi:unnamed protein product [Phytophthora fragariaefolia]|uniref:Unnamed protein product n=1 Tax=Phytophthora fragariaefolia TaxID=1490495 RepID=A0A9W6Y1Y1_9STRA|nr:unnamed protein product [Phytophthora fragariaefolia]